VIPLLHLLLIGGGVTYSLDEFERVEKRALENRTRVFAYDIEVTSTRKASGDTASYLFRIKYASGKYHYVRPVSVVAEARGKLSNAMEHIVVNDGYSCSWVDLNGHSASLAPL
jgi:hypothetical protein